MQMYLRPLISDVMTAPLQTSVKEQLLLMVLNNLMDLPAYKLEGKYKKIFVNYSCTELNKSIINKTINELPTTSHNRSTRIWSVPEIYQRPSGWKICWFSFISLPDNYKCAGWIAAISIALAASLRNAFLSKTNDPWLILIVALLLLIFSFSFLMYGMQLSIWHSDVEGTFSVVNRMLDKTYYGYIDFLGNIDERRLYRDAEIISENFIENDISSLDYLFKKAHLFHVIFASFFSFVVISISGDTFVVYIKSIAESLGFGDFKLIKEL